jgi:hypothetical protein
MISGEIRETQERKITWTDARPGSLMAGTSRTATRLRATRALQMLLVFCLALLVSAGTAMAQASVLGGLTGTITDPSGGAIPGAKVTATNTATNESQSTISNSSGQYRVSNLLPGKYTLTVQARGFKTVTITAFALQVGQTLTQNRELLVGSTSQRVEVSAQAPFLQTTSTGNVTTIGQDQINDLPLNGRNYMSLIDVTPGADGTRISGQWSDGNRFTLDGANNTTLLGATSAYVPNLDLIQEFSIDSNSSKAENGGFLGATVSVATKSGTNDLRGDAWWFGRSQQWEARNPSEGIHPRQSMKCEIKIPGWFWKEPAHEKCA